MSSRRTLFVHWNQYNKLMIDLSLSLWLAQLRPPTTNLQIRKVKDIVHVQMWSFFIVVLVLPHFLTPCL